MEKRKSENLSMLAEFDELMRIANVLFNGSCEQELLQFVIQQEEVRQKWLASVQECERLHQAVTKANNETAELDRKLCLARRYLDDEKRKRRRAEDQNNAYRRQIAMIRDLLFSTDGGRNLNDETREKLQFLNTTTINGGRHSDTYGRDMYNDKLNTITEMDCTGSILSDLSCYSKSEDDLDASAIFHQNHSKREWKEHRPSGEYSMRKRKSTLHRVTDLNSSDRIIATTTVTMPKEGAITASSVIEAVPSSENQDPQGSLSNSRKRRKSSDQRSTKKDMDIDTNKLLFDTKPSAPLPDHSTSGSESEAVFKPSPNIAGYTLKSKLHRSHNFVSKSFYKSETCSGCGKKIGICSACIRCHDCGAIAHPGCNKTVPLPCIPSGNTPKLRGVNGTIADYTPMIPPMVPALVVHCINEVELRGMNEEGLYRVCGGSIEVKCLKEKFLKRRGAPNLSNIDISTICSTLKDFLRSLREPLITVSLWRNFVRATTEIKDKQESEAALYQAISELPQPNRDTLAFLILHLQRVASSPDCKMPISNLAKVFGPTLVGYSTKEPTPTTMLTETKTQTAIVENLLKIPSDYWANFVNPDDVCDVGTPKTGKLIHTPSTESLLKRTISRGFFNTPLSANTRNFTRKNKTKKYFATPPLRSGI